MATFVMIAPTVLVDEFSLTSLIDGATELIGTCNMVERKRSDGGGFKHYLPGLNEFDATQTLYADPADTGWIDLAPGARNDQRIVTATANNGATAGEYLHSHRGYFSSVMKLGGGVGELATTSFATKSSDPPIINGVVGAPLVSRTTAGLTGTAIAMTGPSATQSMYACLHVTAAAGTNLVVKVQSDDAIGFPSPTDRITFSTMSAVGSQWSSVAGNLSTETHWRVVITIASGTFTAMCGFGVA
jgi:hypothetical protein